MISYGLQAWHGHGAHVHAQSPNRALILTALEMPLAPFHDREERRRLFGVDVSVGARGLVWRGGSWRAGERSERRLRLTNVSLATMAVSYRLPAQRALFVLPLPSPVSLRAGASIIWRVAFCPPVAASPA